MKLEDLLDMDMGEVSTWLIENYDNFTLQPKERQNRIHENEHKLKEVCDTLYGQGLEVANWHMNGDLEPLDNLFEENDWFVEE